VLQNSHFVKNFVEFLDKQKKETKNLWADFCGLKSKDEKFGCVRLEVVKLFVSLVRTNNSKIFEVFVNEKLFDLCLNFLFEGNLLRNLVQQQIMLLIYHVLKIEEISEPLFSYALNDCKIVEKIVECLKNEKQNGNEGFCFILLNEILTSLQNNEKNIQDSFSKRN